MSITELLPWLNIVIGLGLVPLVKTLFEINKNLDAINTTVQLLDKDVKYKVEELKNEIENIKAKLLRHDEHIWACSNTLKSIKKGE